MEQRICTSREQSQQLMKIGINPHTADMTWHHTHSRAKTLEWELKPFKPHFFEGEAIKMYEKIAKVSDTFVQRFLGKEPEQISAKEQFDRLYGQDIPAWSLTALMDELPQMVVFDDESEAEFVFSKESDTQYWLGYRSTYTTEICIETNIHEYLIDACVELLSVLKKQNLI